MFHFEVYLLCTDHQGRFHEKDTINGAPMVHYLACVKHFFLYTIFGNVKSEETIIVIFFEQLRSTLQKKAVLIFVIPKNECAPVVLSTL